MLDPISVILFLALWIAFILFVVDFPPQDLDTCLRACLQR